MLQKTVDRLIAIHKTPTRHVLFGHGFEVFGGLAGLAKFDIIANGSIVVGALLMLYAMFAYQVSE